MSPLLMEHSFDLYLHKNVDNIINTIPLECEYMACLLLL